MIVADGIHAQNGLSVKIVGFVAARMTHLGLDTKYGTDLRAILQTAKHDTIAKTCGENPTRACGTVAKQYL